MCIVTVPPGPVLLVWIMLSSGDLALLMEPLEATEILAADESSSSSGASGTNESTEISDLLIEMLDPDSDVILFVGKERKMIWAYSNFLRAISPRFQEMLQEYPGPRYDDEKGLRPMCVKSLPDDDADSMTRLLRALSGVDPGMDEPKPREIQKIGELADKYAMVSRLTYAGSYWLRDRNIEDPADYWYLLIAAYNFRLREPFKRFSKALITRHGRMSSSLLKPATETPGTVSGFRLACEYF